MTTSINANENCGINVVSFLDHSPHGEKRRRGENQEIGLDLHEIQRTQNLEGA
jgi:hypothetical protein